MEHDSKQAVAGFTLVELMITLVILAVLLGIAAPGFRNLLESNRLQTASHGFYTDLVLARSEAIKRNREVVVCKTADGSSCDTTLTWDAGWLVYADMNDSNAPDPNEIITVQEGLRTGDTLRAEAGALAAEIEYRTDGSVTGTGRFVFCNADADTATARQVQLSLTGRPRALKTSDTCTP